METTTNQPNREMKFLEEELIARATNNYKEDNLTFTPARKANVDTVGPYVRVAIIKRRYRRAVVRWVTGVKFHKHQEMVALQNPKTGKPTIAYTKKIKSVAWKNKLENATVMPLEAASKIAKGLKTPSYPWQIDEEEYNNIICVLFVNASSW